MSIISTRALLTALLIAAVTSCTQRSPTPKTTVTLFPDVVACDAKDSDACLRMGIRTITESSEDADRFLIKASELGLKSSDPSKKKSALLAYGLFARDNNSDKMLKTLCDGEHIGTACAFLTIRLSANKADPKLGAVDQYRKTSETLLTNDCKTNGLACYTAALLSGTQSQVQDGQKEMLKFLALGCERNEASACQMLGSNLANGPTPDEGLPLLIKGCDMGYTKSCGTYSYLMEKKGKAPDAIKMLELRCTKGDGEACRYAADFLSIAKQDNKVLPTLNKGCELGDKDSCLSAGREYVKQNNTSNAKQSFKSLCDSGYAVGCYEQGVIEKSLGNSSVSKSLFEKSCDSGFAKSCLEIFSEILTETHSLATSRPYFKKAKELFYKNCSGGDNESCNTLKELAKIAEKLKINL